MAWLEDYAAAKTEHATRPAPTRIEEGIVLEEVSFAYPGTSNLVLKDIDLGLPAGGVVALVGENGAGKTTLVKLLCKMYEPTAGRVLVDGLDLAQVPAPAWRDRLAGGLSGLLPLRVPCPPDGRRRRRLAHGRGDGPSRAAVERAGAEDVVAGLTEGLETQLGPTWPEGVEVSFGQWQKLSLARGFMRDEPVLLVLDEPTAALDAETEHALFERYASAARGGTGEDASNGRITLLVTHRFSTVRMADLIVVMDGARIVEVGTHEDLMTAGGQYAELYEIPGGGIPVKCADRHRGGAGFGSPEHRRRACPGHP